MRIKMLQRNSNLVPLIIAFTPNYFIPAATCLYSLFENIDSKNQVGLHIICLLSEELPERMKRKIRLIGGKRAYYSFVNLKGKLQDIYIDTKYTEAASYRLLLPDLLPEYDKVMYIDCDVIVRNDLVKLYHTIDLEDNYLAAVFEAPLDFQIEHFRSIGCNPMEYINSGFLIMNLELMRQDNMVKKFLQASKNNNLEFPDQDVLNQLCKGRILGLPPYYNSIRTFFLPQYKQFFLQKYTEQDWRDIHHHGTVHYTGAKPWNHFTVEFQLWWQHYERLPIVIRKEWKANLRMYFLYKIYTSNLGFIVFNSILNGYRFFKYKSYEACLIPPLFL